MESFKKKITKKIEFQLDTNFRNTIGRPIFRRLSGVLYDSKKWSPFQLEGAIFFTIYILFWRILIGSWLVWRCYDFGPPAFLIIKAWHVLAYFVVIFHCAKGLGKLNWTLPNQLNTYQSM